jgi:hypothetical protein
MYNDKLEAEYIALVFISDESIVKQVHKQHGVAKVLSSVYKWLYQNIIATEEASLYTSVAMGIMIR